jgi:hypothetical protein
VPLSRLTRGSGPTGVRGSRLRRGGDPAWAAARHIVPWVAMRRARHGSGLGRWRFRRLRVRYDKRADIHEAFLSLGCALISWRALRLRGG